MAGLLDYAKQFYEGGAKPRALVSGLLQGDTAPLQNIWGEVKQLADPEYMKKVKPITNKEAMDMGMMALTTTGGKLADVLPKTKYELAHEIAQKNAVEMLGLPPNNTAMDRAKALGFDTPAYHGTNIEFEAFDPSKTKFLNGVFATKNPQGASAYVERNNGLPSKPDGGFVMPLMTKSENTVSPEYFNINNIKKLLSENKTAEGGDVLVIPQANKLRSKFAAFDPARAHEADLLGIASPELLAYLAGGWLLGAGAYKYGSDK